MGAPSEGQLERDGVRLRYVEWRPDEERWPPILLLHGLGSNALFWGRLAERLTGRRLVALDQRSHGHSDRPPNGYGSEVVVADAAHAIESLGLGRPFVAGHSWGAAIALELAGIRPDLVSGLAFVDGPAAAMSGFMSWEDAARAMQPPLSNYGSYEEAMQALSRTLGDGFGPDLEGFVRAGLVQEGDRLVATLTAPVRLEILRSLFHYQPEVLFAQVQGPILLAMADNPFSGAPASMLRWRRRAAETAAQLNPATQVRWYRSGHDIPLFLPDELAADVHKSAVAAAFADVAWRAGSVEGDWARPVDDGEGYGNGDRWTARDLLAHLASTETALSQLLRASQGGTTPSGEPFDPDRWNASQVRRRRESSPSDLVEELWGASSALHAELLAADLRHPAALGPFAGRPLEEVLSRMLAHQRGHLATLESVLRG
jgi:pimeloyl-ACP methyl ester carboxylesterase